MKFLKNTLLLATTMLCTAHAETTAPTFYQKLGEMVLSAEQALVATSSTKPNMYFNAQAKKQEDKPNLTVVVDSRIEQLQTFFVLLDQVQPLDPQKRVFNNDVVEKLNLVSGTASDKKHSILDNLPLQSIVGTTSAAEILALCNNTESNQEIVRYFAQNPAELHKAQKALQKIEAGMGMYLTFFKELSEAEQKTFARVFFGEFSQKIGLSNKSVVALSGLRGFQRSWNAIGFTPFLTIIKHFIMNNGWYLASKVIKFAATKDAKFAQENPLAKFLPDLDYKWDVLWQSVKDGFMSNIIGHCFTEYVSDVSSERKQRDLLELLAEAQRTGKYPKNKFVFSYENADDTYTNFDYNKRYWSIKDNIRWAGNSKTSQAYIGLSYLIADFIHGYCAYSAMQNIQFDNTILNNLQIRLMGVAKIAEGLTELTTLAQEANLASLTLLVRDIEQLLAHTQGSSDLGYLVSHLLSSTFKGTDPSYWSNRPRILATYTLLNENKTAFVPALRAAGMVDALQAAAQLYLDHQEQSARYSFVTFVNDARPTVQLTNFWNPLMKADQAVCNTVHLGKGGDKNMLLTGPNGSGKSVNMKAIALNIILAQAFGIAAADQAILTPFSMIETYLNEQEDLQQGLSTFMTEAKKLDDICRKIRSLKPGEKIFVLMDEMLKGTVEEAGAQKVYAAGLELAQQDNAICIMATHFLKPTDLEHDTNHAFVNYHVELLEPELGQFIRTFKLVPHANLWWFGKNDTDAAKRGRFIRWLTSLNS